MAIGTLTEEVIEEVATNLEEAAVATRALHGKSVGLLLGGLVVGAAVGFYFGSRYNREKIYAEIFEQSERELEIIREAYRAKETPEAAELPIVIPQKPPLDAILEERQYSQAVTDEEIDLSERPLKAPVPVDPAKRVFRTEEGEKNKDDGWVYPAELAQRTAEKPFIIHQDEFALNETDFAQTTYTYYAGDEVLADTDDTVLDRVDDLVGLRNLMRFGHGADDFNVLFVRNPKLELDIEICRSNGSYEQEVIGLEHSDTFEPMHRHRRGFDDDDTN